MVFFVFSFACIWQPIHCSCCLRQVTGCPWWFLQWADGTQHPPSSPPSDSGLDHRLTILPPPTLNFTSTNMLIYFSTSYDWVMESIIFGFRSSPAGTTAFQQILLKPASSYTSLTVRILTSHDVLIIVATLKHKIKDRKWLWKKGKFFIAESIWLLSLLSFLDCALHRERPDSNSIYPANKSPFPLIIL